MLTSFRKPVYVAEVDLTELVASEEFEVHYHPRATLSCGRAGCDSAPIANAVADFLGTIAEQGVAEFRGALLLLTLTRVKTYQRLSEP